MNSNLIPNRVKSIMWKYAGQKVTCQSHLQLIGTESLPIKIAILCLTKPKQLQG
jgi:hypothetical protein